MGQNGVQGGAGGSLEKPSQEGTPEGPTSGGILGPGCWLTFKERLVLGNGGWGSAHVRQTSLTRCGISTGLEFSGLEYRERDDAEWAVEARGKRQVAGMSKENPCF